MDGHGEEGAAVVTAVTREQEDAIIAQAEEIKKRRNAEYVKRGDEIKERVQLLHQKQGEPFTDADLIYSAWTKCVCGSGLAYPKNSGFHGAWDCSLILTGKAEAGTTHDPGYPFTFWDIKSEGQPSAGGATTRPKAATS